jgi:hypothetical protein
MSKTVWYAILLVAVSSTAQAQSFFKGKFQRSLILTGGIGSSTYFGELANPGTYFNAEPNINLGLQYFVNTRTAVRVEANWFTLQGDDKNSSEDGRESRNLSFQSSNFEISAVGMVSLFENGNRYYRRPTFNVYGFAGIGMLYFNPKATDPLTGESVSLQPLKTEGVSYSLVTPCIPYGLGVRLKLSPQFNISVEGGWRKLFTDYLDDASTTYPGVASFSDPQAARMSDRRIGSLGPSGGIRGNPKTDDAYMMFSLKLEYYLPVSFNGVGNGVNYSKKRKANQRYNKGGRLRKRR